MVEKKLFFIDIETNSQSLEFDIEKQELIQIGIYNHSTKETFQKYINIKIPLSEFIKRLTWISDKDIEGWEDINVALNDAIKFIGNPAESILVGHNISWFDLPILSRYSKVFSAYEYIDTLELFLLLFPWLKSYSVQDLYALFIKKDYKETHRALQDCIDEHLLFSSVINIDYLRKYYNDHEKDIYFVKQIVQQWSHHRPTMLWNYMKEYIIDLFKDIVCDESIKGKQGLVEKYFKKQKEDIIKENNVENEGEGENNLPPIIKMSTEEIDFVYQNFIKRINKESRSSQRAMIQNIKDVFNNDQKNLFIEAWTGIGKTFWYILPSMEFIKKNPEYKVFFSTYTKVLQEQLWNKDIPLIKKTYPNIQIELLKANSEAISLQNIPFKEKNFDFWDLVLRNRLYRENFYISDLSFIIVKSLGEVRREKYMYNASINGKYFLDEKYGFRGKFWNQLKNWQIFVINHAFMVTNLNNYFKDRFTWLNLPKLNPTISPSRAFFVVDEWHNLESVIRDDFTIDFTKSMLDSILGYFTKSSFYTIVDVIKNKTKYLCDEDECFLDNDDQTIIKNILLSIESLFSDKKTQVLLEKYRVFIEKFNTTDLYNIIVNDIQSLRNKWYDTNSVEYGKDTFDEYYTDTALKDFFEYACVFFNDTYEKIKKDCEYMQSNQKHGIIDIFYNLVRYFTIGKTSLIQNTADYFFNFIVEFKDNGLWIKNIWFTMIPNDLSKWTSFLRHSAGNVVLSATLFDEKQKSSYVLEEVFGWDYRTAKIVHYNSPFNYETQRKIYVPKKWMEIRDKMNILHKFIEKYNWKTLILTTTTAEKIRIAMDCKNHYENRGILTLMHKTGGLNSKANQKNVNHLRENPDTILIWSKSYMEWVDVPWNNLSLVVLTKLPFLPPRPFIDFKENQYKNKWYKFVYRFLSSINFRQAIWRLIRHQTDLGEILILDERISEKSWEFFRDYIKGEEVIEI